MFPDNIKQFNVYNNDIAGATIFETVEPLRIVNIFLNLKQNLNSLDFLLIFNP
jgi:hypothetical protein